MKTTLTIDQLVSALRSDQYANWSYYGSRALAEYFDDLEESTGEELELDLCAIRCDYSEHNSLREWLSDHSGGSPLAESMSYAGIDMEGNEDVIDDLIRDYISDRGHFIEFAGGVIVSNF